MGAVEGHGRTQRRGTGTRGGGRTRKKRAAVSRKANGQRREEEEGGGVRRGRRERIDLRQALEVIYQGDLLPVPATSREKRSFTPGACYQPGVKV